MAMVSNPLWEDQIVPTLRKRLETESLYLSHRLSTGSRPGSFLDSSSSPTAPFPLTPTFGPVGSPYNPEYTEGSSRKRTQSTVTARDIHASRLSPSDSSHSTSHTLNGSLRSTRQPTRQRSNTQLAPKFRSHIPIPKRLGSSPPKSSGSVPGSPSKSPSKSYASPARSADGHYDPRGSVELERGGRTVEGLVQNELPPFRMFPDEAMRIAERGHALGNFEEGEEEQEHGQQEASGSMAELGANGGREVRKRSMTMRGDASTLEKRGATRTRTRGNGRSAPSTVSNAGSRSTSAKQSPLNSSTNSNSEKSRLGLAAHWIPPETYTPPKGANWDDVVLPAVAKKLGIGVNGSEHGEEGDLAVEWDKDGTPVKWIKREHAAASGANGLHPTTTSRSFNPSFEPSWDNPLTVTAPLWRRPSREALEMGRLGVKTADLVSDTTAPNSKAPVSDMTGPSSAGDDPMLRPEVMRNLSAQASNLSLRSAAAAQLRATPGGQSVFGTLNGNPPGGRGGHMTGTAAALWAGTPPSGWPIERGALQTMETASGHGHGPGGTAIGAEASDRRNGSGRKGREGQDKARHDQVGSGCGCIVM